MQCDKCDREAVLHAAYSGSYLCDRHLVESVERRVRRRIRKDDLLPDWATPDDPVTWVIGLSGGKDSTVLTRIVADTFGADRRVEIVALSIDEGIDEYREESLEAAKRLASNLDVRHETVSFDREFGVEMDRVAEADPLDMAPCAYCGVFRRDVLGRYAERLNADILMTGHNLDDEAETALMNIFEGDVSQIAKHFDASLGPLSDRRAVEDMTPRAKPLRDVPEREVALYAHLEEIPAHVAECPHAAESFRGEIQDLLHDLEEDHPGTRHSILAGYEDLAQLAASEYRADGSVGSAEDDRGECSSCGQPTRGEKCRRCELLTALEAT